MLLDLIRPIVDDKNTVSVKQMESLDENEILLYVYADNDDVARLIGRRGIMAGAARNERRHVTIKFEAY